MATKEAVKDVKTEVKTPGGAEVSKTGQGAGVGEAKDAKVDSAKGAAAAKDSEETNKFDYDEWVNKRDEEREIEGGEMSVGSGLEKGRPIKEDGTLDTDQPSLFEQRFSESSASVEKAENKSE